MKCIYCNDPAFVRCKSHKQVMCGSEYCVRLHRWGGGNCSFYEAKTTPFDWMKLVLGIGGLAVAIVATGLAYAHLARIQ